MDWEFVVRHLISGSFPTMAALVVYFIILRLIGKKQTTGHVITSFVFVFYLIGLLTVTGICIRASFSPRFSFIPFVDMIRGPVDTVLNILLFVPMGFFLSVLYEKYDTIGKIALAGFLVSLSVEIIQMFGFGATDINDLITNTIGACLGYGIFKMLIKVAPESWEKQIRVEGSQGYYELLIFWVCSVLIMLIIQPPIYKALFAAGMGSGEIQVWQ